jgi:hypothetical protein
LKALPRINGRLKRFGLALERTRPTAEEIKRGRPQTFVPLIEDVDDFRFRHNDWMYSAPVEKMVGRPIFGYGPQSWHPLVAGCLQLLKDPDTPYRDSVLRRFYETFAPATIAEAYRLSDPGPLTEVPAASLFEAFYLPKPPYDDPFSTEFPSGTPVFGPQLEEAGEVEWRRLRSAVLSVQEFGYRPDLFERGLITATILKSRGQVRYHIHHGLHRTAVLAAMGVERIDIGVYPRAPWVIDESEADQWPYVKSGFLTKEQAIATLRRYFTTPENDPALEIAAACGGLDLQRPSTPPESMVSTLHKVDATASR